MLHILVSGIRDIEEVFQTVEFGTLFFFAALFILMDTLKDLGLIDYIADLLTCMLTQ
jgi:Na+/H+ antiporter NhaD/arsenite permease-like protein